MTPVTAMTVEKILSGFVSYCRGFQLLMVATFCAFFPDMTNGEQTGAAIFGPIELMQQKARMV